MITISQWMMGAVMPTLLGAPSPDFCENQKVPNPQALSIFLVCAPEEPADPSVAPAFSLDTSLRAAIAHAPATAIWESQEQVRLGLRQQALIAPNPRLAFSWEDFAGIGSRQGIQGSEVNATIHRRFALSAHRQKHSEVYDAQTKVQRADLVKEQLLWLSEVAKGYVELLGYQEHLEHSQDALEVTQRFQEAMEKRVRLGVASPIEKQQAHLSLVKAQMEVAYAQAQVVAWKRYLGAHWQEELEAQLAGEHEESTKAAGHLDRLPKTLPAWDELLALIPAAPQIRRFDAAKGVLRARLEWQSAQNTPDLDVGVGLRYHPGANEGALIAQATLPLPWQAPQAGMQQATRAEIDGLEAKEHQARLALKKSLALMNARLQVTFDEAKKHHRELLPLARNSHQLMVTGFEKGRYASVEVLATQKALFEAIEHHHLALVAFHQAVIDIENLLGQPLPLAFQDTLENHSGENMHP